MSKKLFERSKGFTLVELMVVIAIIGILAVAALGVVRGAQQRAVNAAIKASSANLSTALETYYSINTTYPATLDLLVSSGTISHSIDLPTGCNGGAVQTTALAETNGVCGIRYQYLNTGQGYQLDTKLVGTTDLESPITGGI